ncbi:hypothetical protein C8R45DRAFT_1107076 [Mycena sanguinolenta]|nr:hypothetical protein C8R45DRAFT_1107076 [Mycena sanguinolenta]
MFRLLFCCCARPGAEADATVIPTETTHLITGVAGFPSPGLPETITTNQFQHMQDKMGTIVRSTEGKMVNVSARTPFILQSAPRGSGIAAAPSFDPSSSPTTPTMSVGPSDPNLGRHPPVFTMTPSCARLQSRYPSTTVSRSSSCKRASSSSSDRDTFYGYCSVERGRQVAVSNKWFSETDTAPESESPVSADEHAVIPHSNNSDESETGTGTDNIMSIAFSWGDV